MRGRGGESLRHEALAAAETRPVAQAETSTQKPGGTKEFFRKVANWGIQAAEALEHAHQLGILRRDIKPSNVLVDGHGHLWITEFGLAQIAAPSPFGGEAIGLTIQADGKIVAAGHENTYPPTAGPWQFAVAPYNVNGSLDTSFGPDQSGFAAIPDYLLCDLVP